MNFPTGQTPPPPGPYYGVPTMSPEPAGPGLSEPQRLVNMFIAPKKTFTDIRRNPSWWAPWVVTGVFVLTFGVLVAQKVDLTHLVQTQIERSPAAQRQMEQLTPEQRERAISLRASISKGFFYGYPVVTLLGGLLFAAVFLGVYNFILGAEVSFQRATAVVFYSYVPWIISTVLLIVSLLVSSDPNSIDLTNPMPTNAAFFLDPLGNRFLYSIAYGIDIFNIWTVTLIGMGFSVVSTNRKPDKSTGITTAFVVFVIFLLCRAALTAMFT